LSEAKYNGLYDVISRWLFLLGNYRCFISDDPEPFYADEEIAVVGNNTGRLLIFKEGRINQEQVASTCKRLRQLSGDSLKSQ
jgi:hypothetical protein